MNNPLETADFSKLCRMTLNICNIIVELVCMHIIQQFSYTKYQPINTRLVKICQIDNIISLSLG
jgi:hypothetical protein